MRPRIVLSEMLVEKLGPAELRTVLAHELVHWQRRDTWVGWLQVAVQSVFWFHPFVWWANREIRHQRECVCDDLVLRTGRISPDLYGQSILSVLTQSRARSLAAGSLVGVFEPGAKLQNRMEEIMNFEPKKRSFDWRGRLYWAAIAMAFVPMGFGAVGVDALPAADAAEEASKSGPPQIVKTSPATGDVDVDPKLREISVTFDRDMGRGMSWTGGPPLMPPIDEARQARWINARTCVLPVKLEKATFYRVGINAPSFKNFSDKSGMPAPVSAIYFTTAGATEELKARARGPKLVKLSPANGAKDVDPATTELVATFDMPMSDGMSWTGSGPNFPQQSADGKEAHWSADGLTCTLPVSLEPNHDYRLGLNSPSFKNFQSKWGVPLDDVIYEFHTRGKGK